MRGLLLPDSPPVAVRLPALDVSGPTIELGLDGGALEVPGDGEDIGWYTGGPTPGELGPAVLAAHVTWDRRPAVFFRLGELRAGDRVEVERADGVTAVFAVTRVDRHPKDEFPTAEVYRDLDHSGLRLITCGGEFDESSRHYLDNIVVFGELVDVLP